MAQEIESQDPVYVSSIYIDMNTIEYIYHTMKADQALAIGLEEEKMHFVAIDCGIGDHAPYKYSFIDIDMEDI